MNMKPSSKQCEIARAMTRSEVTNSQIMRELSTMTESEWDKQCEILDKFLKEHNISFDKGWDLLCTDFINIAAANQVDEATLFVAYMDWMNR